MKKLLISLSLLCTSFSVFSMDPTGGASSASTPQTVDIITSDGIRIPLTERLKAACGFFRDFEQLPQRQWTDVPLTIHSTILRVLLQLIDDPQRAMPSLNSLSLMQLDELHEAASLLVVAPAIQTLIANRVTQELPRGLSTLNKADFKTFLHHAVKHLIPENQQVQVVLALQLAKHGIRPMVTTIPTEHGAPNIVFAPDGTLAYTTDDTDNWTLYLYDRTTQQSIRIQDHVADFTLASDGTLFYMTAPNHALYLYDRTTRESTHIQDHVFSFRLAPDGTLAYTTDRTNNWTLYAYDRATRIFTPIKDHAPCLSFAPDGTLFYKTDITDHNTLYLYNRTTQQSTRIRDHVDRTVFASDGTLAYRTDDTDNYTLYLYDRTTQQSIRIQDHVRNFSFSPDGTLAYTTDYTDEDTLYLYNRTTQQSIRIQDHVLNFSFSPDGTLAYTTLTNNSLYLYNRTTRRSTHIQNLVVNFSFAPDGTLAYITLIKDRLYLYDRTTQQSTHIQDHVQNFLFSPDGTLATILRDRRLRSLDDRQLTLWDFTHGMDTAQQLFALYILVNEHARTPITFTPQEIVELETGLYRRLDGTMPSDAAATNTPPITMAHLMVLKSGTEKGLLKKRVARNMPTLPPLPAESQAPTEERLRAMYGLQHASLLDGLPEELRAHIRISDAGASGAGSATDIGILRSLLRLVWR